MLRAESTWLDQLRRRGDDVQNTRVLVACSGGGDSTALLVFLWGVRRSLKLDLVVAHADHGLRPEAQEDADFVRDLCRHLDLDLAEASLDVRRHAREQGIGLETAARELRWEWLKAEAASIGAEAIATGHTLDDHTETVFIRLARGGGLGALTPLPARQAHRWSPLIEARREELRDYLRQKKIPWREDATNEEGFTPRNRWRALLEGIRAEAPTLDDHLWETHSQIAELVTFREAQVAATKGLRWQIQDDGLHLKGTFEEVELRWILEAAFRQADWPREAEFLRDLAAWLRPHLGRKSRKPKTWGSWSLEPAVDGWAWSLTKISREIATTSPSPT
ncbi:MAG: tRNA lysidine(34) synthetase TilS [Holophaga sp.]|nr:tRNA lysidine(34) synthetase TilS [Holophaga sp.]